MKFLGYKLTHLREVMGWTKAELGRRCDLTASQIYEFESGKRQPNEESLKKIAKGSNIAESYFYLEDSELAVDVIPDMPDELKKFIANGTNIPWLKLSHDAKAKGISPEAVEQIIEIMQTVGKR